MPHLVSERAHRRFVSKGTVFLAVSCLITFVAVSHAELYVIAHLPYGGGWSSRIVATNPSSDAVQVELKFFSKDGRPVAVPIGAGEAKQEVEQGKVFAQGETRVELRTNGTKLLGLDPVVARQLLPQTPFRTPQWRHVPRPPG